MDYKFELSVDEEACFRYILSTCSEQWQFGPEIIVRVMEQFYLTTGNTGEDLAIEERLRHLHQQGLIDIDHPDKPYGKYSVKL